MSNKSEVSSSKKELELLFNNLFQNKLIFHERVTVLCELVNYDLAEERFKVELKVIKALNIENVRSNALI